ncbi:MAG: SDR family NAD(P)-dependent oxidoreductase, partial [Betaproteobacteria bacterium]
PPGVERHIADVTDANQVAALARALRGMALDVLFCNAGIAGKRGMALGSFDYESWQEVFRVNVLGAASLAEALVDNVAASERKVIAMMSSRLGSIAEAGGVTLPYATSKAALNML